LIATEIVEKNRIKTLLDEIEEIIKILVSIPKKVKINLN
jgi:hypothetical protein